MLVLEVNKFYFPTLGGVETVVQQLAEGLSKTDGLKTLVLCCQKKGKGQEEIINGVKVIKASSYGVFRSMPVSLSFFKLFRKYSNSVDVIDLHHPFPLSFLAYYIVRPKARVLVHYHSDIIRQNLLGWILSPVTNFVLKRAEKIVVSNPNLIENSKLLKRYRNKCEVVNFGVDVQEIEGDVDEQTTKNIIGKYGKFVLFVGRLGYYKGVQYLLRAIVGTNLNLVIIGEGAEKNRLVALAKELKIENQVVFLVHVSRLEKINFYKAAQVVVLPSIYKSETFGIVLLEAMACGTPVVSTELGTGTSYVNQHGVTGLVVPPTDSDMLREALYKLTGNESERTMFGKAARLRVGSDFALSQMLARNVDIITNLSK